MKNKSYTNTSTMSSTLSKRPPKYIPVNVVNYITELKAIELSNYIIAMSVRYGLDEEKYGNALYEVFEKLDLDNIEKPVGYMRAIANRKALEEKDNFRKEYKVITFNSLYQALDSKNITGSTKDYFYLEMLENHLINEFLTQDEVRQLNHNIVDYMSEHCEHELSKFIEYVKHSRYVNKHANIPYDVFEKEAIESAKEWEELTKEVFEDE